MAARLELARHELATRFATGLAAEAFAAAYADVDDGLRAAEADLDELELAADEAVTEVERHRHLEQVAMLRAELAGLRGQLRQRALQHRQERNNAAAQARRGTLLGRAATRATPGGAPGRAASDGDEVMEASASVTAGLRRTMQLMQQELDRSVLSTQLLEQSTSTLAHADASHGGLTGLLQTSRGLLRSMERADIIDRLLIAAALAVFGLVCLYVLHRRIIGRGLRVAVLLRHLVPTARIRDALTKTGEAATSTLTALDAPAPVPVQRLDEL